MKKLLGIMFAVLGMIGIIGIYMILKSMRPQVMYSSISPDKKWICEIADVHPSGGVYQMVLHVQPYEGHDHMERDFRGVAYVEDLDSSLPNNITISWNGDEVTVNNFAQQPTPLTFRMKMLEADKKTFTSELVK